MAQAEYVPFACHHITEFGLTISDADNLTMDPPWSRYSSNIATYLMVYLWVSQSIVSTYPKIYRKADHLHLAPK